MRRHGGDSPEGRGCELTCVVEVSRPLVVVGELGEHGLGHELLGLVVQVEVQVVPQQQVQQHRLPVGVVPQGRRAQAGVQEAGGRGQSCDRLSEGVMSSGEEKGVYIPADDVELVLELVHSGVVIVTLGGDQVESAAVLGDDLLQQVVRHFLSLKHKRHRQHVTERPHEHDVANIQLAACRGNSHSV